MLTAMICTLFTGQTSKEGIFMRYSYEFKKECVEGLIMHSDQGWQYQNSYYTKELEKHQITQSMSRKGNCYDNCIMETFFGRLKTEMYYGCEREFKTFEEFSKAIDEYIYYYNNERIQKKTKWMPPTLYRLASINVN